MQVQSLSWEEPPEKEMATHSSILAWEIPWTEEPGRPQSTGVAESAATERIVMLITVFVNAIPAVMASSGLDSCPRGDSRTLEEL